MDATWRPGFAQRLGFGRRRGLKVEAMRLRRIGLPPAALAAAVAPERFFCRRFEVFSRGGAFDGAFEGTFESDFDGAFDGEL